MLVEINENLIDEKISHSVTIVPRLDYSMKLLDDIVSQINEKRLVVNTSNQDFMNDFDELDKSHVYGFELEKTLLFSQEVLSLVKKQLQCISGIHSIPEKLPSVIPVIRTISARLFSLMPFSSQKLSELSVHLGSIVLDSAALTKARFDFSTSSHDSAKMIDKVNLIVDSKLSKQYPYLDFSKVSTT